MGESVTIPNFKFNAFYCMFHSYHHMYESGLGLKRLVDYYFLLKAIFETAGIIEEKDCGDIQRMQHNAFCICYYVDYARSV